MKIFTKKSKTDAIEPSGVPVDELGPVETASFTNGSELGSKLVSGLVILAVLCGPAALGMMLVRGNAKPAQAAVVEESKLTPLETSAGSFAVGFVGSWLSATRADSSALEPYVATVPAGLGEVPFEYRNLAITEITKDDSTGFVTALVAGDIREQLATEEEPTWVRRYFEVVVDTAGEQLAAVGYPAPVVGPEVVASAAGLSLSTQVSSTSPAVEAIQLMLGAYLTGQGSTSAYLTPGTTIPPITPAPFASLTPVSFYADGQPAESPADGDTTLVQAIVTLQTADARVLTATYFVDLTARAGRWEVTQLSTAQSSSTTIPTAAPTPSSTDDPTEGEDQ